MFKGSADYSTFMAKYNALDNNFKQAAATSSINSNASRYIENNSTPTPKAPVIAETPANNDNTENESSNNANENSDTEESNSVGVRFGYVQAE